MKNLFFNLSVNSIENILNMGKMKIFLPCVMALFLLCSFKVYSPLINRDEAQSGVFTCLINDKTYTIQNMKARMRTVTGGSKQLSLSNDLFTSFFFINPVAGSFELSSPKKKDAIVRYTNPSNLGLYYPDHGVVKINTLDQRTNVLSGEFEMELTPRDLQGKKIKVTQGKFINIPIVYY